MTPLATTTASIRLNSRQTPRYAPAMKKATICTPSTIGSDCRKFQKYSWIASPSNRSRAAAPYPTDTRAASHQPQPVGGGVRDGHEGGGEQHLGDAARVQEVDHERGERPGSEQQPIA